MSDAIGDTTARRVRHFVDAGYPDAGPVEAAVEGAVYRLGDGTVAKVWERRRGSELRRMQRFYADAAAHLPFGAPEITRQLTTRFADEFGYAVDDLLLYRAAYAMATSDAFAPGGGDEHFAWCVTVLEDPAVAESLHR